MADPQGDDPARRVGASWREVTVTATVNLLLGLLIVGFKLLLKR
ncbi:hypothetical protein AB0F25_12990 [Streptomyces wedmorensis]